MRLFLFTSCFCIALFASTRVSAQRSFFFRADVLNYHEQKKIAGVVMPSSSYGLYKGGWGPQLSLNYSKDPYETFPLSIRTAVVLFKPHMIESPSGQTSVSQVLVPLDLCASLKIIRFRYHFIGVTGHAGPQFISTIARAPGSGISEKTKETKFGWGLGLYFGYKFNNRIAPIGFAFRSSRIGGNNFQEFVFLFSPDFYLK